MTFFCKIKKKLKQLFKKKLNNSLKKFQQLFKTIK